MTDSTRKIEEGTVIAGTMRPEDLIPAFMAVLKEHAPDRASDLEHPYPDEVITQTDTDGYFVNEVLFDALDELAPEGMYFGAHPGDGSDYGFWAIEED